jgi:hypothetical protein
LPAVGRHHIQHLVGTQVCTTLMRSRPRSTEPSAPVTGADNFTRCTVPGFLRVLMRKISPLLYLATSKYPSGW